MRRVVAWLSGLTMGRRDAWRRRWPAMLGLLALAMAFFPSAIRAEEGLRFKLVEVTLMPEYDDRRVMVMYTGEVAPDTKLPTEVQFRVPGNVAMNATCSIYKDGKHSNEIHDLKEEDGFGIVTYKLTEPKFHLEFYYNPLEGQTDKSFAYSFQSLFPVDKLNLDVQQPLKATNFTVSPAAQPGGTDSEGFNYYHLSYTDVAPQKPFDVKVSYTKTDPNPSRAKGQTAAAGSSAMDSRTLLLVVGGVMVAGLGFFAYNNYGRRQPASYGYGRAGTRTAARREAAAVAAVQPERVASRAPAPRGTPSPRSVPAPRPEAPAGGGFCTNCGTRMDEDDRFCPTCGKKAKWVS